MKNRILVFGAGGYSGRMVVEELVKLGRPLALGGRSEDHLETVRDELGLPDTTPIRTGDALDPATLPGLFEGDIGVVINCVGPYLKFGEPVVAAAIEAGVHYLDLSGEPPFIARIIEEYDEVARDRQQFAERRVQGPPPPERGRQRHPAALARGRIGHRVAVLPAHARLGHRQEERLLRPPAGLPAA
jgi:hypothetical protein